MPGYEEGLYRQHVSCSRTGATISTTSSYSVGMSVILVAKLDRTFVFGAYGNVFSTKVITLLLRNRIYWSK